MDGLACRPNEFQPRGGQVKPLGVRDVLTILRGSGISVSVPVPVEGTGLPKQGRRWRKRERIERGMRYIRN